MKPEYADPSSFGDRPERRAVEKMYHVPQRVTNRPDERIHVGYWEDQTPLHDLVAAQRVYEARLVEPFQLTPQHRLLDVGCGWGESTLDLAAQYGCKVHGIDLVEPHVSVARREAERRGLADRARFDIADIVDLPFETGTFDFIIAQEVLVHLPDRANAIAELARCLRPGGLLAVSDQVLSPTASWLCRRMMSQVLSTSSAGSFDEYHRTFSSHFELVASEDVTPRTLVRFYDWTEMDNYTGMKTLIRNGHGALMAWLLPQAIRLTRRYAERGDWSLFFWWYQRSDC